VYCHCYDRQYDAEYLIYGPSGQPWLNNVAITKRVNYVYQGAAFNFQCNSDEYPVVESAARYIWSCKQDLTPLLRYPCAQGDKAFGGCTSQDYSKQ
jgi:hypothetical protein